MVRTRFGTAVKVLGFDESSGIVTFCRTAEDQAPDEAHISEFRADGGSKEIQDEAAQNRRADV